jgi:hypothetical protein
LCRLIDREDCTGACKDYLLEETQMGVDSIRDSLSVNCPGPSRPPGFGRKVAFLEDAGLYGSLEEDRGDSSGRFT